MYSDALSCGRIILQENWMSILPTTRCRLTACLLLLWLLAPAWAQQRSPTILVMGDSLSAGYGMAAQQGWVSLLDERVQREFPGWKLANASISGETSAGGAARIKREIARHQPSVVVIELGGNDGLRGLPVDGANGMRGNLSVMIEASQHAGAHVLLLGMQMPPNLGADYVRQFARTYPDLAERYQTALVPFMLEPIAHERTAFQHDHIHPTAAAQPRLLDHIWPVLRPLIGCAAHTPASECGQQIR